MTVEADKIINQFEEIDLKKPADVIIEQIRSLISGGVLKPGDRLPSERALAERFGVGRGHIREALKRLEFYGILKTLPQSGTVVASLGVRALEGLIANVLDLEKDDLDSLMETRVILEINTARLAAERATEADIVELTQAHEELARCVDNKTPALDEDHIFHLKIAECSKNSVLRSLVSLITPDVIFISNKMNTCRDGRALVALKEHKQILDAIRNHDPEKAVEAMKFHMQMSKRQFGS